MRLFLDECLSPHIALALNDEGDHVVLHPRNDGGLGDPDHRVLARCIDQDLVLVTQNARGAAWRLTFRHIRTGLFDGEERPENRPRKKSKKHLQRDFPCV